MTTPIIYIIIQNEEKSVVYSNVYYQNFFLQSAVNSK